MSRLPFMGIYDIKKLFPPDWKDQIARARAQAHLSVLEGGEPTSLEAAGTTIEINLLDGDDVSRWLPWLIELYSGPLLSIAESAARQDLILDDWQPSAVNVNILPSNGRGYELHVDSNPVTGVLFLSTHSYDDGGLLEMEVDAGHWLRIPPIAGQFVVFDARQVPHRVTPSPYERISAPMNFHLAAQGKLRPDGLDDRLYAKRADAK